MNYKKIMITLARFGSSNLLSYDIIIPKDDSKTIIEHIHTFNNLLNHKFVDSNLVHQFFNFCEMENYIKIYKFDLKLNEQILFKQNNKIIKYDTNQLWLIGALNSTPCEQMFYYKPANEKDLEKTNTFDLFYINGIWQLSIQDYIYGDK